MRLLSARAAALFILVAAAYLWAARHLGIGSGGEAWLAPIGAGAAVASSVVGRVLGKRAGGLVERLDGLLVVALSTPVLATSYVLFALVVSTCSSVTVTGASPDERGRAALAPADGRDSSSAAFGPDLKPARFFARPTGPFGRLYRVSAPGYVARTFEVYPVVGLSVELGKDLLPSPAVLFRPPPDALASLEQAGAEFVVDKAVGKGWRRVARGTGASAFLLGSEQAVPPGLVGDWSLELQALGEAPSGSTLLRWKRAVVLTPSEPLAPGDRLRAQVFTRRPALAASAEITLRNDRLTDVLMEVR